MSVGSDDRGRPSFLYLSIALVWLFGYAAWFYSVEFPNNRGIFRWMFWANLPFDLFDLIDPPVEPGKAPWSWWFLLERVPFISVALVVWAGSWGIGALILRLIRLELRHAELLFFSLAAGLSATSLIMLFFGVCGYVSRWPLLAVLIAGFISEIYLRNRNVKFQQPVTNTLVKIKSRFSIFAWLLVAVLLLFVFGQLIGAMTPQYDFDVIEYHLGGPKEWFQIGRIQRLPHNVYTSFPFLSEMLVLSGMAIYGDWGWGALAGQSIIAGFAPLTAIGLYAAGRRWFGTPIGLIAALVYLSSPWTYRITIIAYTEGALACYLFGTIYAVLRSADEQSSNDQPPTSQQLGFCLVAGLMAGSAMACKYTGLVLVIVPAAIILGWIELKRRSSDLFPRLLRVGFVFAIGVALAIGPWLIKNLVETGNPVYPLAVRIFGGVDRDSSIDAKWRNGHAAKSYASWGQRLADLPVKLGDISANNDWHSSLMFGLAPLTLLLLFHHWSSKVMEEQARMRVIKALWFYAGFQFFVWWVFTHHIDRFYVPMFAGVSLLAGIGAGWWSLFDPQPGARRGMNLWNVSVAVIIIGAVLYNANFMQHGICGFNAGRLKLLDARETSIASSTPRLKWYNEEFEAGRLPSQTKVLFVGEARIFHARFPYLYNTVFDHELLEQICIKSGSTTGEWRSTEEIREELVRLGITLVDVCWAEVLRYKAPGSYGYTDFVNPATFAELQRRGILGAPLNLPDWALITPLGDSRKQEIESQHWEQSLVTTHGGEPAYYSAQVFPVLNANALRIADPQ